MGNSLQDQLLKAGLISEQQVKRTRSAKRGARKRGQPLEPEAAGAAARERERRREADRERNLRIEAERQHKASRARVRDLVLGARLNDERAEIPYHFVKGKRVKHIYVTAEQQAALGAARLAITAVAGRHHIIPLEVAEQLRAIAPEHFVYRADEVVVPGAGDDAADYPDHPIPDDLIW